MESVIALSFIVLEICAILLFRRAIVTARTSQGAVAWAIFLVAAPYLGVPLYMIFGKHRCEGYLVARRESIEVIRAVRDYANANAPERPSAIDPMPFERIADLPVLRGNDMRLVLTGDGAIYAASDTAEAYVLVQSFIVNDDGLGRRMRDHLVAAAKRGVAVRFMVDAVGSIKLPTAYHNSLRDAGVDVIYRREGRGPRTRFQINFRNHRKTVIVDGVAGFTGGFNVGYKYLGLDPKFGHWRDTHLELRGLIVSQLQLVFAEDWHWARSEILREELFWDPPYPEADMSALLVQTGLADPIESGALFFFSAAVAARRQLWIPSPHCVPDVEVLTALKHASVRGMDVRLMVQEVIDHRTPWLAAFACFDELRASSMQIWRYDNEFMQQKVVLVDDFLAAVGTANLDNRSLRLNFEAMAAFFDERAVADVAAMLEEDFKHAVLLEKNLAAQSVYIRVGAPAARLLSPLL